MAETLPDLYVVEKIIKKKMIGKKPFYLVKWENFSEKDNTWEPEENLESVMHLVEEFEEEFLERNGKRDLSNKDMRKQLYLFRH